ncbi:class D sortase [Bacillus sp. JJ1122]|uniref:class D sortase n=1 Tax=Bacillus sp. JJ1122 TaxID=3122951 RepID=UPI003000DBC3
MVKKVFSIFLILTGFSIFFYPAMKDLYTSYSQKQMMDKWENNSLNENEAAESLGSLEEVFSIETKAETVESANPIMNQEEKKNEEKQKVNPGMVGVIEIDKINLRLPVLNGASMANMAIGAGLLEGTALPGKAGNTAIAAHRNRAYGKMFNRLDEIATGDLVTVKDKDQAYQYEVYETLVVEPNDVSVLMGSDDEKTLTLITCTPIDTATHRLIIKAKMP